MPAALAESNECLKGGFSRRNYESMVRALREAGVPAPGPVAEPELLDLPEPDVYECRVSRECSWLQYAKHKALTLQSEGRALRKLYSESLMRQIIASITNNRSKA
ncbi:hypothetical protein [Paraburkholderia sp. SARCC-3016]|uniref:hypothetical protein n=1 Tax=Paraburkholderia sp. SARCC-3016 TaxID=3058611 RepID=UPI00280B1B97|nr:hypothetical protein [Paraburkholderia sp. SARCC-3016]